MTDLIKTLLPSIESELQRQIARLDEPRTRPFHEMLTYHMGWTGEGAGPEAAGKRIRPLLVLLTCAASQNRREREACTERSRSERGETKEISAHSAPALSGAEGFSAVNIPPRESWENALPAAACIELIHNFSLVHDDIQDQSALRRGRPTVWKKWGMPQAINVGDALFILAHLALFDLHGKFPAEAIFMTGNILHQACLDLTRGQYLDISYEKRNSLSIQDYWPMISAKTAALLATCTEIGAVLGGVDEATQAAYRSFGHYLGLAFQVQDDILGIWGDEAVTGKSAASDLVEGKKSLPVLYGLEKKGPFARRWAEGPLSSDEVPALADQLAREGAKAFTQDTADQMTDLAMQSLRQADPQAEAGEALFELANLLLNRQS